MRNSLRPLRTAGVLGALLLSLAAFTPNRTHQTATSTCTSDTQCPSSQLCCNEFGYFGTPKICKTPVNGHCPAIP